jgi:hypothetical protein
MPRQLTELAREVADLVSPYAMQGTVKIEPVKILGITVVTELHRLLLNETTTRNGHQLVRPINDPKAVRIGKGPHKYALATYIGQWGYTIPNSNITSIPVLDAIANYLEAKRP